MIFFFLECLKQMSASILRDGIPIESLLVVNKREFVIAGELMAMSLLQNGPVPNILAGWCYKIISSTKSIEPMDFQPIKEFLLDPKYKQVDIFSFIHITLLIKLKF